MFHLWETFYKANICNIVGELFTRQNFEMEGDTRTHGRTTSFTYMDNHLMEDMLRSRYWSLLESSDEEGNVGSPVT